MLRFVAYLEQASQLKAKSQKDLISGQVSSRFVRLVSLTRYVYEVSSLRPTSFKIIKLSPALSI